MDGPDWRATVRLEPAAEITDAIDRRRPLVAREGTVSVTELVDPRPAFFRRRSPVPVPPGRRRRQAAGRALHERIGSALAAPGHREIRVRRGGIVGFVDLVEELPIELKTTERLPADGPIAESRPSYLEQLAWYCALLGADRGRLLVVADDGGRPGACRVFDVAIADRDRLLEELDRRAAALRSALAAGSPDLLPRCRWVGRGCEFASAGV
ncbi:MAG TPA: hypothetical protein VMH78_08310, partial [Thermoplasmata archaeon]|nr:hypothetical protein [Thermoplasmata archaeon]